MRKSSEYVREVFDRHLGKRPTDGDNHNLIAALLALATVMDASSKTLDDSLQQLINCQHGP